VQPVVVAASVKVSKLAKRAYVCVSLRKVTWSGVIRPLSCLILFVLNDKVSFDHDFSYLDVYMKLHKLAYVPPAQHFSSRMIHHDAVTAASHDVVSFTIMSLEIFATWNTSFECSSKLLIVVPHDYF